jgi:hypothetical protein
MKRRRVRWWLAASAGLLAGTTLHAQDEGLGSFTDLVNDVQDTVATATPTPPPIIMTQQRTADGKSLTTTAAAEPDFFSSRRPSFAFEYRFKQDKTGALFGVNAFETRPGFGITLGGFTDLKLEYVHVWFDGDNDAGATKSADENGIKLLTNVRVIPDTLDLSFPFSYSERNTDTRDVTALTSTRTEFFATNPFVSLARTIDASGKPLKLIIVSGVRFGASDRDYTNTPASNVRMWLVTTNLQLRAEYGVIPCAGSKTSLLTVIGSGTWSHVARYYSSDNSPLLAANSFGLAAGARLRPVTGKDANGKPAQPFSLSLNYQYDGFNRESYQHAVNFTISYTF